jgi:hypothetical protein
LRNCGVTKPWPGRIRQIVEGAGRVAVALLQVVGDGVGAGVQALVGQARTELDDLVGERV